MEQNKQKGLKKKVRPRRYATVRRPNRRKVGPTWTVRHTGVSQVANIDLLN